MHLFAILLLFLNAAFAQSPDRPPLADEWGYRPADGSNVSLNPPSLTWVHEKDAVSYTVQWADTAEFARATTINDLPWSVYTHHSTLKAGTWFWRYRIVGKNAASTWSVTRRFILPANAVEFPQPAMEQLRQRIPKSHPRLFVRSQDLDRLKSWSKSGGTDSFRKILDQAGRLVDSEPTSEPSVRASASDPKTAQFWWSNRVQTIKALQEAEVLSFAWLLTGNSKYGDTARRFTLRLAAWDPDGPTNFKLNCEAAKPMLYRLARAYDWAWPLFTAEERVKVRAVLLRRATDAWNSGEVRQGAGHLNQPYSSHGNRTWHKLAENAIATFDETTDSEQFLRYAVTKFFAAYPVWADDDGGWHEGLSYFAGYMSKAAWWVDFAQTSLGIDSFKKPFFAHFADYAMYSAPPGSREMGFGDLAHRPPGPGWSFLHFFVRHTRNPQWAWWLEAMNIPPDPDEPVLAFLWGSAPPVETKPPTDLPTSKVFRGTGVAVLNTTLLKAADNVQVRFKSSPMGTWSHGLDPQNAFTLSAYGVPLLVNNVYRDLYGSPFHKGWVWTTRAQNAVLVDNIGQKYHSAGVAGRIVKWDFQKDYDYVLGDATPAYEGRLTKALRHVVLVKPDLIVIADEFEAPKPSTFQWMLHGQAPFDLSEPGQRLVLDRKEAGVVVDYAAAEPLKMRQWTGYDPEPNWKYLESIKSSGIPPQWHVEAASAQPSSQALTFTVMRVYRNGPAPSSKVQVDRRSRSVIVDGTTVAFGADGATIRRPRR
jgi:uncharacterized protein DUF4962/heparinase II/III-like protein